LKLKLLITATLLFRFSSCVQLLRLDPGGGFEASNHIQFQREVARALPLVEHIWHTSPLPVTLPESSSALPRSTWHMGEYEYEPLDELIATPPFTRCACYYRYPRLPSYALPGCKVTPIEPLKLIYPNSTLASLARQIQSSRA